jgi:excisionase family DNA binding protein
MLENGEIAEELLTVSEVAAALKVPVSWVYERTRRSGTDQIPHFKLGKYLRFRWTAVREWLDSLSKN